MKFIPPPEISGKIMTLIKEADKKLIIVSPYNKINDWDKLLNYLNDAIQRNVKIEYYIRENVDSNLNEILNIGIKPIEVKNLHAKLYLNEKKAIVSSMNLSSYSDTNSIDIGYETETEDEYNELQRFIGIWLVRQSEPLSQKVATDQETGYSTYNRLKQKLQGDWREHICNILESELKTKIKVWQEECTFHINTGRNNYKCFIANHRKNSLRICGILSNKEYEYALKILKQIEKDSGLKIELQEGGNGYYDTIWGEPQNLLMSNNIGFLKRDDIQIVVESIISFVHIVENLKDSLYTSEPFSLKVEANKTNSEILPQISMSEIYTEIQEKFNFGNRFSNQPDGLYIEISNFVQSIYKFKDDELYHDKTRVLRQTFVPREVSERIFQHFQKLSK
jgi:hypothetical protein